MAASDDLILRGGIAVGTDATAFELTLADTAVADDRISAVSLEIEGTVP